MAISVLIAAVEVLRARRDEAPEKLDEVVNLLVRQARRDDEVGADGEQGAERPPGRGVVAQLELDLPQHRSGRARGRVGRHHPLRHLARLHEGVACDEGAGQHLGRGAVVRGPEPEGAPGMPLGVPQVGLARREPPALQEEPGQLAVIPRRQTVPLEPTAVERDVQLQRLGLARRRIDGRRLVGAGDRGGRGERRAHHEQSANRAVYR